MKNRKDRRFKVIALVLCLLLTSTTICLLFFIMRYNWLAVPFGLVICLACFRILAGSSKQRRQARKKNASLKVERRQWQNHRFFPISKRGRAAYLILCFEEVLKFYNSKNLDCWKWLLSELWQITSTWDIDRWVGRIGDASPETVLEYRSYQEREEYNKRVGSWYNLTEEEFISLKKLYEQEKDKPFFPVIYGLYKTILDVITLDWGDLEINHTPSALSAIDEAEQILTEHSIACRLKSLPLKFMASSISCRSPSAAELTVLYGICPRRRSAAACGGEGEEP